MSSFHLSLDFLSLKSVRKKMGAPLITWQSDHVSESSLLTSRLSFAVNSLEELTENVGVRSDKVLIDKKDNSAVVLYIKDHRRSGAELESDPSLGNKVHLTWCQTLERMTQKDSFDRYVATKRTTGSFEIEYHSYYTNESGSLEVALHVCTHCLRALKIDVSEKGKFNFEEHMLKYSGVPSFKKAARYSDTTAPENVYPDNWDDISLNYRQRQKWICEECSVDLSRHKSLLDTHHINGLKHDIRPTNLRALCKTCHKACHPHYIISKDAESILASLRHRSELQQSAKLTA